MLSWLPQNISTYGGDIDSLIAFIYYIVGVWFIGTQVFSRLLPHPLPPSRWPAVRLHAGHFSFADDVDSHPVRPGAVSRFVD